MAGEDALLTNLVTGPGNSCEECTYALFHFGEVKPGRVHRCILHFVELGPVMRVRSVFKIGDPPIIMQVLTPSPPFYSNLAVSFFRLFLLF